MLAADTARTRLLSDRYQSVRSTTLALIDELQPEDTVVQSMPDVSPTKWHLAHTTWFFETFVLENVPEYRPFHPYYRVLYNSYYQKVGDMHPRPHRGLVTRPSLTQRSASRLEHRPARAMSFCSRSLAIGPSVGILRLAAGTGTLSQGRDP